MRNWKDMSLQVCFRTQHFQIHWFSRGNFVSAQSSARRNIPRLRDLIKIEKRERARSEPMVTVSALLIDLQQIILQLRSAYWLRLVTRLKSDTVLIHLHGRFDLFNSFPIDCWYHLQPRALSLLTLHKSRWWNPFVELLAVVFKGLLKHLGARSL
jgi:hypothetical protein